MTEIRTELTLQEKLHILADAAKYDVACTSSGVDRRGREGYLGNSVAAGICHSFASDGRCISLLKILLTNHCIYDCRYCLNRSSNDVVRTAFTPQEICRLTIEFYRRNYIEGLFLSSGVWKNPAYTMERICETLYRLRREYRFNGYIHVKVIPGAPEELLAEAGCLADRVSVNLELPTAESLRKLAPNKTHEAILRPMRMVADTIAEHRLAIGKSARMERSSSTQHLADSIFSGKQPELNARGAAAGAGTDPAARMPQGTGIPLRETGQPSNVRKETGMQRRGTGQPSNAPQGTGIPLWETGQPSNVRQESTMRAREAGQLSNTPQAGQGRHVLPDVTQKSDLWRPFAPAGQSTQMIIGATPETDYHLLKTTQFLYQSYDLKRVFFSAYVPLNEDSALPAPGTPPPLLREHRLYQADWLLRFYGFHADELLSESRPNFNEQLDPKCDWALRHLELFPVEINTAPYDMILRIPGIGPKSALRIVQSRRYGRLDFPHLKKMGVVLKRAHYFITCNGRMMYATPIEERYITRQLTSMNKRENWQTAHQHEGQFRQLSLFDDFRMQA